VSEFWKAFFDVWNNFLQNDKSMVIFAVFVFGVLAFYKVQDPSVIISNITSGLFGLVTGMAITKATT
jgi:multidrug efflux pump subunit AcrB